MPTVPEYHAVYCFHCARPLVFAEDVALLRDPFQMMCHWHSCQQKMTYHKSVVLTVRLEPWVGTDDSETA
jgi:hypothetical protein